MRAFWIAGLAAASLASAAALDTSNKTAVLAFYQSQYLAANPPDSGFTGDVKSCKAGTTSAAFKAAVLRRVNYFRAMAGVPLVVLNNDFNAAAQQSALMNAANNRIEHYPPASWNCYTPVGAAASGHSNLFEGETGWGAIDGYINEQQLLGHRRWILFSALQQIGTGDIPGQGAAGWSYNSLYVISPRASNAPLRDDFIAWPPNGFVPYKFVFPMWSFSLPDADFSAAVVQIRDSKKTNIPVSQAGPLQDGFGDNTFAFVPKLPALRPAPGGPDLEYTVVISNIKVKGAPAAYGYTVTLVDVNDPPTDLRLGYPYSQSPAPAGSSIATLSATDDNPGSAFTYALVNGPGSDDNQAFRIGGTQLVNRLEMDFDARPTWRIRVRADNGRPGGRIERALVVKPF